MSVSRPSIRSLTGLLGLIALVSVASYGWRTQAELQDGRELSALARPGDIRLISSVYCPSCTLARRWLEEHGVAFDECFIERDEACRNAFTALMAPGTPVVIVRGRALLGFDPERVSVALQRPVTATGDPAPENRQY